MAAGRRTAATGGGGVDAHVLASALAVYHRLCLFAAVIISLISSPVGGAISERPRGGMRAWYDNALRAPSIAAG